MRKILTVYDISINYLTIDEKHYYYQLSYTYTGYNGSNSLCLVDGFSELLSLLMDDFSFMKVKKEKSTACTNILATPIKCKLLVYGNAPFAITDITFKNCFYLKDCNIYDIDALYDICKQEELKRLVEKVKDYNEKITELLTEFSEIRDSKFQKL